MGAADLLTFDRAFGKQAGQDRLDRRVREAVVERVDDLGGGHRCRRCPERGQNLGLETPRRPSLHAGHPRPFPLATTSR